MPPPGFPEPQLDRCVDWPVIGPSLFVFLILRRPVLLLSPPPDLARGLLHSQFGTDQCVVHWIFGFTALGRAAHRR